MALKPRALTMEAALEDDAARAFDERFDFVPSPSDPSRSGNRDDEFEFGIP